MSPPREGPRDAGHSGPASCSRQARPDPALDVLALLRVLQSKPFHTRATKQSAVRPQFEGYEVAPGITCAMTTTYGAVGELLRRRSEFAGYSRDTVDSNCTCLTGSIEELPDPNWIAIVYLRPVGSETLERLRQRDARTLESTSNLTTLWITSLPR